MKKYLLLSDGNSPHTWKWIRELNNYFDVFLISFNGISEEVRNLLSKEKIFDLKSNISKNGGNFQTLKNVPNVIRIMNRLKPDFINAHYLTSYGTVATISRMMVKNSSKLILSMWGSDILVTPRRNKAFYFLTKFVLSNGDYFTSDSEYMSTVAKEICKNIEIMTFPFGLDKLPDVTVHEKQYDHFFSNRGFKKIYNIDCVIELFEKQHQLNPNSVLYIANDGEEKERIRELVVNKGLEGNVFFLGYLSASEMETYYRKCGFYFSVPSSDSTSVSLLEALAYGCIPIVSDIPANHEWVERGKNGYIVDLDSENTLVANVLPEAFYYNRELIKENAIWPIEIERFAREIM